ncbi:hypothetical protein LTR08_005812 [Meristemomyces frigidus]|nr:hypothetical protein LTR08_005812 [Meristemomyces frigidus]
MKINDLSNDNMSASSNSSDETKEPAACAQVQATTELMEMILLRLPMKELLFAQAVCRFWKTVIEGSAKLQQALFFQLPPKGWSFSWRAPKTCRV